ncbi:hypothetical protein [Streptomyces sp. CB01881]|uniref:hypothetical protein n=1 Tax=Streptomyces sp. CB01881 TaxID=2078691 RepID=UPI0011DF60EB|nr:hypothetical protein [Streptomyces sp. CB01881]TYC68816.1 hypothetical protein EH183_38900 [Streptomyces sp. CB01881]
MTGPTREAVWRAVAPDGYRAFGDLVTSRNPNDNPRSFRQNACVRVGPQADGHTYVYTGAPAVPITDPAYSGCWAVTVPAYTGDVQGCLPAGGYLLVYSPYGKPVGALRNSHEHAR